MACSFRSNFGPSAITAPQRFSFVSELIPPPRSIPGSNYQRKTSLSFTDVDLRPAIRPLFLSPRQQAFKPGNFAADPALLDSVRKNSPIPAWSPGVPSEILPGSLLSSSQAISAGLPASPLSLLRSSLSPLPSMSSKISYWRLPCSAASLPSTPVRAQLLIFSLSPPIPIAS